MNISTDCVTRLLFQMFFAVCLHVLLADFLLFVSRPTDTLHRTMICNYLRFTFCTRCYLSLFFVSCLSVSIKNKRHVDTSDSDCTEYGTKRLSMKTGSFVISCSNVDPYQDVRTCNCNVSSA